MKKQLVEKMMFFLQAFLFCAVSLYIHLISGAEKALPLAQPCLAGYVAAFFIILNKISGSSERCSKV